MNVGICSVLQVVVYATFGRSGQIAAHGSLSLRPSLRVQLAAISSVKANTFSFRPYRISKSASRYRPRAAALGTLDAQHVDLTDQVLEDDGAVVGHCTRFSAE